MGFLTLLILAIVIGAAVFGLNQIMMVAQDVKYIRSVLTSHLDQVPVVAATTEQEAPPAAVSQAAAPERPEGVPPPRNDVLSAAIASASAWADAAGAMAARSTAAA